MAELNDINQSGTIPSLVFNLLKQAYKAGQISYDPDSLTVLLDSGVNGVRLQAGQEEWYLVCNNSGGDILNGTPCFASGVNTVSNCLEIGVADYTNFGTSAQVLGLATHDILDGELGLVTYRGLVRDLNTNSLNEGGIAWLGAGVLTNTQPLYPFQRILMGTVVEKSATTGKVMVAVDRITRNDVSKSYSFTSQGIAAGLYWKGGFYDFNTDDANLNEGATLVNYGDAGMGRDAHAGIVPSGPGSVTGGQVGLRVSGILDSEDGTPQQAGQIGIITDDITTLEANKYYETSEKWSGQITFELYVVSGTPTVYNLDFNYGFAKYDDLQDRDYTITGFECVWQGNGINSTLDIALMKHASDGWTYAATGFIPGNGDVCRKSIDMQIAGNADNNLDGAYKRVNLNQYIAGESGEGHIIQVTTGGTNTVQTMDMHVEGVSEELNF